MDKISANITEIPEKISANITEIPEKISANISEPVIIPDPSTYKIDFGTDTTKVWGIYSKFNGSITSATFENVTSYKIDGIVITFPFPFEFDQTYLIEIVKTNPALESSILFNVNYIAFDEVQDLPDFSIGNGHFGYGLSKINNEVYKLDLTKATISNYAGVGAWSNPLLDSTITLPTLPANGKFKFLTYLIDGQILISGHNSGSNEKYFCYLLPDNSITNLEGNTGYSSFVIGYVNNFYSNAYNYVDNYIYFLDQTSGFIIKLDLNTNIVTNQGSEDAGSQFYDLNKNKKVYFNPFKKVFVGYSEVDLENMKNGNFIRGIQQGMTGSFNRVKGYYIKTANSIQWLRVLDENSKSILTMNAGSGFIYAWEFNQMLDHDNNVAVFTGRYLNFFTIFRIDDNNKEMFYLTDLEASQSYMNNGMFAYGDLHIGMSNIGNRIFMIDTSDPGGTAQPDFGYYDFPTECIDFYTNRIL